MAEIINVNFKTKKLEYTWNDEHQKKVETIDKIHRSFLRILDNIEYLTDDDIEYQTYVARQLGNIICNLNGRL